MFISNVYISLWLHVGMCRYSCDGSLLLCWHSHTVALDFSVTFQGCAVFSEHVSILKHSVSMATSKLVELLEEMQKAEAKGYNYTGAWRRIAWLRVRLHKLTTLKVLLRYLQAVCTVYAATDEQKTCLPPVHLSLPHCVSRCFTSHLAHGPHQGRGLSRC